MNIEEIKSAITTNVYHIPRDKKVPLHKHSNHDEVFFCIKGNGYGVLEDSEVKLTPGKAFIVPFETMHALRSDNDLYVASFLIPNIK